RGLHCKYGPDGGVYVSDWSDIGECHDAKEEQCDKTGGRIYKIIYSGTLARGASEGNAATLPPPGASGNALGGVPSGDLTTFSDKDLIGLQRHKNEWFVRHSRRLLQERAAARRLDTNSLSMIRDVFRRREGETDAQMEMLN